MATDKNVGYFCITKVCKSLFLSCLMPLQNGQIHSKWEKVDSSCTLPFQCYGILAPWRQRSCVNPHSILWQTGLPTGGDFLTLKLKCQVFCNHQILAFNLLHSEKPFKTYVPTTINKIVSQKSQLISSLQGLIETHEFVSRNDIQQDIVP